MSRNLLLSIVVVAGLAASGCEHLEETLAPSPVQAPSPLQTLEIQGPSKLSIGDGAVFTAKFKDSNGTSSEPTLTTWSASPDGVLTVDKFSGIAAAKKAGTVTVTVLARELSRSMTVVVSPKVRLEIVDLPPTIGVGEQGDVEAVAIIDNGSGEREYGLSALTTALPGSSNVIQWSTTTGAVLLVKGRLLTPEVADVTALAVGTGIVQVSVAGLTAIARTTVTATAPPDTPRVSLLDLAAGTYSITGKLSSNTCAGTNPISSYDGTIVIGGGDKYRSFTLSYLGQIQREFRAELAAAFPDTGEIMVTSDPLPFPFGTGSPVTSTRITGTVRPTTATPTKLTETMTCPGGAIVFDIDTRRFF